MVPSVILTMFGNKVLVELKNKLKDIYAKDNPSVLKESAIIMEANSTPMEFITKSKDTHEHIFGKLYPGEIDSFTSKEHLSMLVYEKEKIVGIVVGCEFKDKELGKNTITILMGIEKKYRGKGLSKVILKEYFDSLKDITDVDIVRWKADKRNKESLGLAESMGFVSQYKTKEDVVLTCKLDSINDKLKDVKEDDKLDYEYNNALNSVI